MSSVYYETGRHLIAASIALAAVDVIAVAAKFWVRRKYKQGLKADDWLLVPATLLSIVFAIILSYGAFNDAIGGSIKLPVGDPGRRAEETYKLTLGRKIQWPFLVLHPIAMGLVRCSFLLFYLRIFSVNRARIFVLISIGVVVAWSISFFFAELFQCGANFTSNWSMTLFLVHCPDTLWILFFSFLTAAILDVYILILPMPFILRLKLPLTKKLGVMSILVVGAATVVASVIRLSILAPSIFSVTTGGAPVSYEQRSARLSSTIYWGQVELGVAIFVACLPTIQKVLRPQEGTGFLSRLGMTGNSSRASTKNSKHSFNTSASSRAMGKPQILVDQSVDVAYEDADNRPILGRGMKRTKNGEENMSDIEMHAGLGRDHAQARTNY
ncbi:unnamed protein product [Periconia digitata]|uniref:Rhodopsin domain-containing protein n=1 Tax=Periconia digitata TaxID=1303443 RepID=A0A9W4XQV3_9PLEO|nr:unnamed protein product [Periconia digitata]